MSANPDAAEVFNHWLDLSMTVACILFLAAAAWAVGAEWVARRRAGRPLFDPWPRSEDPALGGEEVQP